MLVFGDIHGHARAAETAVKLAEDLKTQAIFLGDYIDRGIESFKTLMLLNQAKGRHPDWVFLCGNHEKMLLDLIERKYLIEDEVSLKDGGFYLMKQSRLAYVQWRNAGEEDKKTVTHFLNSLPTYHETDQLIFTHAVLRNTKQSLADKSMEELLWNYNYWPLWKGKQFVHGHLRVSAATRKHLGYNINTQCGNSGYLTGLYIENEDLNQTRFYVIEENGALIK